MKKIFCKNEKPANSSRRRSEGGFTLLEILIATVILAIGLLGVAGMQLSAIQGNAFAHKLNEATELIQTKFDDYRNRPFDQVVSEDEDANANGFTRTSVVQDNTPIDGAKTVVVTISWTDDTGSRDHSISFQTIISD